jgi:hypothetical protein
MVILYIPNNGNYRGTISRFHRGIDKTKVGALPWYKVISENGFNFERTSSFGSERMLCRYLC